MKTLINVIKTVFMVILLITVFLFMYWDAIKMFFIFTGQSIAMLLMYYAFMFGLYSIILTFVCAMIYSDTISNFYDKYILNICVGLTILSIITSLSFLDYTYRDFIKTRWVSHCKDVIINKKETL